MHSKYSDKKPAGAFTAALEIEGSAPFSDCHVWTMATGGKDLEGFIQTSQEMLTDHKLLQDRDAQENGLE